MAPPVKKPKLSKGNKKDECWKYTIDFPDSGRTQTKCLFCKIVNSGGINRLKYHIAGIRGHDAEPCKAATVEAQRFCYVALEKYEQEKELKQKQLAKLAQIGSNSLPRSSGNVSMSSFTPGLGSIGCVGEGSSLPPYRPSPSASCTSSTSIPCTASGVAAAAPSSSTSFTFHPRLRKSMLDNFFGPCSTPGAQPSLESLGWNREIHPTIVSKYCAADRVCVRMYVVSTGKVHVRMYVVGIGKVRVRMYVIGIGKVRVKMYVVDIGKVLIL